MKKLLAIVLTLVMLLSIAPLGAVTANAEDDDITEIHLNQEVDDSVFNLSEGVTTNETVEENSIN